MECSVHPERAGAGFCSVCNRVLCEECVNKHHPPCCPSCLNTWAQEVKNNTFKKIGVSVLFFAVALVMLATNGDGTPFILTVLSALYIACIPFGWRFLNSITPDIFLFLPLIGWVIYFMVKFFLASLLGVFIAPVQIYKMIKEYQHATVMFN